MPDLRLLLPLFCLILFCGCKKEHVPPADLITPDQDSAELSDPMAPTDAQGLTAEDPLPEVRGDGSSLSSPAVVTGVFSRLGKMEAENDFISARLGKEGESWKVKDSSVRRSGNRSVEIISVETAGGGAQNFYFDITEYESSWQ